MDNEFKQEILQRLNEMEDRVALLERAQNSRSRALLRRFWLHPPMWKFEQYPPRRIDLAAHPAAPALPAEVPRIAIVTPSYNHARFLDATIDSVLGQSYPNLHYHVQDGASVDGTVELLKNRGDRISWRSEPDNGQSHAINLGFAGVDCDIMAYLNSDDALLPGTLAYVVNFFQAHPDIDIVYGHRVFVDRNGLEIGRAVLPAHDGKALQYADYIPQETMFWRSRVWQALKSIDENFHYAMDWDFILRAQAAGFKFARLPRFLACFRIHDQQKTAATLSHWTEGDAGITLAIAGICAHANANPPCGCALRRPPARLSLGLQIGSAEILGADPVSDTLELGSGSPEPAREWLACDIVLVARVATLPDYQ